jgi:hypothetical protein
MTKEARSDDAQREPHGVVLHPKLEEVVVLQLGRLQQRLPQVRGQRRQGRANASTIWATPGTPRSRAARSPKDGLLTAQEKSEIRRELKVHQVVRVGLRRVSFEEGLRQIQDPLVEGRAGPHSEGVPEIPEGQRDGRFQGPVVRRAAREHRQPAHPSVLLRKGAREDRRPPIRAAVAPGQDVAGVHRVVQGPDRADAVLRRVRPRVGEKGPDGRIGRRLGREDRIRQEGQESPPEPLSGPPAGRLRLRQRRSRPDKAGHRRGHGGGHPKRARAERELRPLRDNHPEERRGDEGHLRARQNRPPEYLIAETMVSTSTAGPATKCWPTSGSRRAGRGSPP